MHIILLQFVFQENKTEIGNHELTRIVGQQWNNLSAEEKQVEFFFIHKIVYVRPSFVLLAAPLSVYNMYFVR